MAKGGKAARKNRLQHGTIAGELQASTARVDRTIWIGFRSSFNLNQ
jgi:hypothetical protein